MNTSPPNVVVCTRQLGKRVASPDGSLMLIEDVDLDILAGERVAITGPSGAGKSTLLGLLAGLDRPSSGTVWLDGQDLGRLDEDGRAELRARAVGFVFQSFQLLASLTAEENVCLPLELAGHPNPAQQARTILAMVGLAERIHHYPNQLSGGEQQRVALARAFARTPKVLFADEPTGNLDERTGERIADLMFDLNCNHGTTLVLVTHDARLAARCDRRLPLHGGRLLPTEVTA